MARDRLLDAITALPFTARVRRLREVGLESRTQPDVAAALNKWERGDWQERFYCVQSCTGSEDATRLHRMVDDPSRTVAGLTLKLLAIYGSDDDLVHVLGKSTHRHRIQVLSRLRSRRRLSCVDRFLDDGFAGAFPRIAELLPFGSPAAVQRHLVDAEQRGGLLFWQRLARQHPRIAAQAILKRLSATDEPDAFLLQNARAVSAIVGRRVPEIIAPLARTLARFTPLSSLQLNRALPYRANELAEILLESDGSGFISLVEVAHKLESSVRLRILREQPSALPIQASWFRKLPTSERALIFQEIGRSWRDADGLIPSNLLGLLPSQQQVVEADRITALPIMLVELRGAGKGVRNH